MNPPSDGGSGGVLASRVRTREPWLSNRGHPGVSLVLRWLVGGIFIFAGGLKLADPAKFVVDVGNYRLVPHELVNLVAVVIPGVEVVAGLFLIFGAWTRAAAMVITGLTVVFLVVIISALARGLNIECGCFGTVGGHHIGMMSLAIDAVLLALAALLAVISHDVPSRTPVAPPVA